MNEHPVLDAGDQVTHPLACRGRHRHPQALVLDAGADGRHQIELAPHFMADQIVRFALAHPVGEERIRVLAAVGQPQRNVREQTKQRGRERALAVHGEHHRGVKACLAEAVDHRLVSGRVDAVR